MTNAVPNETSSTLPPGATPELLIAMHRMLHLIRICEESFVEPIISGQIRCPAHLYSGQEAIATGLCAALTDRDYVLGSHRSHGHYLAKGGSLQELVAELYCKETGCSRGRGGSMHLLAPEVGMLGGAPIVAGTVSLALGAAYASRVRGDGRVAVSFFGDGAAGEGVVFEALNLAAIYKLPLIFACENNLYSTHLPILECRPNTEIFRIAAPFDVMGLRVDGNDVLEVYRAARSAVSRCRDGMGPVLLEFMTYRYRGHVGPDDNIQGQHTDIRPQAEVDEWLRRDPIPRLERVLVDQGILCDADFKRIQSEVSDEVREAHRVALGAPNPVREELTSHVFAAARTSV